MSKAKKTGDLYLASNVHVRRDDPKAPKATHTAVVSHPEPVNIVTIAAGQMVSDTDLTEDEVKDLMRHEGVLRAPTYEEMQAMDSRDEQKAAAEAAKDVESERQRVFNEQKIEREQLEAENKAKTEKEKAALAEKQAKERADAEKAAGSGKSKK